MEESDEKVATIVKFKGLIETIMEEENTAVLYPYSELSSAVPITALVYTLG